MKNKSTMLLVGIGVAYYYTDYMQKNQLHQLIRLQVQV